MSKIRIGWNLHTDEMEVLYYQNCFSDPQAQAEYEKIQKKHTVGIYVLMGIWVAVVIGIGFLSNVLESPEEKGAWILTGVILMAFVMFLIFQTVFTVKKHALLKQQISLAPSRPIDRLRNVLIGALLHRFRYKLIWTFLLAVVVVAFLAVDYYTDGALWDRISFGVFGVLLFGIYIFLEARFEREMEETAKALEAEKKKQNSKN